MSVRDEVFHLNRGPVYGANGLYRVLKCPKDCVNTIRRHVHLGGIKEHICYFPEEHLSPPEDGLRWFLSGRDWTP